jgi:proline iminopeptidase
MPIDDDVRVEMADGTGLWTSSTASSDKPGMVFLHGGPGMWDYLGPVAELAEQRTGSEVCAGDVSAARSADRGAITS